MSNLHSFIELTKPKKVALSTQAQSAVEITQKLMADLTITTRMLGRYQKASVASEITQKVITERQEARLNLFKEELTLPEDLQKSLNVAYGDVSYRTDHLTRLNQSPRTTTQALRTLADRLNMVLIPAGALNKGSIKAASYDERSRIQNFLEATAQAGLDAYVICPISMYDVEAHASSTDTGAVSVYSKRYESVMLSISMQIPMFRSILASVANAHQRIDALETSASAIRNQVKALQIQVDRLQVQLDREVQAAAQLAAENETLRAAIAALETQSFRAVDPMLFAVRKDHDLLADGPAIVGPAWGPDLPQILIEIAQLIPIKGQEAKLKALT